MNGVGYDDLLGEEKLQYSVKITTDLLMQVQVPITDNKYTNIPLLLQSLYVFSDTLHTVAYSRVHNLILS